MLSLNDPAHLDFAAISAHKMYAPFGTGALVGRRDIFNAGDPDQTGGGTVEIVTLDDVVWAPPPERDEAGSPNTVGAIALSAAIKQLNSIGMGKIAEHEAELTGHALEGLLRIPGIRIFGDSDPSNTTNRLGVIPFKVEGMSHFKVAAILGYEFGIGVRSGCFCAHPYILHLLSISPEDAILVRNRMLAGDKSDMPGLIRVSFGLYNTHADFDTFIQSLDHIVKGEYTGDYVQEKSTGEYIPKNWNPGFNEFFSFPDFP
jgi:selenocysteine lyase/cysteine desulfurase